MKQNSHIRELSSEEIKTVSGAVSWTAAGYVAASFGAAAFGVYTGGFVNGWGYGNSRPTRRR
ncbi:hypothetical protein [Vibrio paracholerae]|uniref:Bacteriocin n=1 Tax=Vibrio paracholerae TaxID=650003 RepID=A0ABD7FRR3_9VIBR|nr:hypothetical protein [Vibrio paracholerae]RBM62439.1 hypothetical protein DLR72_16170 [Vibrio paracholerae]